MRQEPPIHIREPYVSLHDLSDSELQDALLLAHAQVNAWRMAPTVTAPGMTWAWRQQLLAAQDRLGLRVSLVAAEADEWHDRRSATSDGFVSIGLIGAALAVVLSVTPERLRRAEPGAKICIPATLIRRLAEALDNRG